MKLNATNIAVSILTLCVFSCSEQPQVEEIQEGFENVIAQEEPIVGKWLVLANACDGTFDLNGLETITINNQTFKMGSQNVSGGTWEATHAEDKEKIIKFIDTELPCINQNIGQLKFKSYLISKGSIVFAISEDEQLMLRKVDDVISVATTYSEQKAKEVLSKTPFEDEPLPYDPFSIDEEITSKSE